MLLGIAVIVVIFGGYEIVERTWPQSVDMSTLHLFHILRGVLSSLITAGLVEWLLVRGFPSLLVLGEKQEHFARWFIQMRWVAVLVALTLVFISWTSRQTSPLFIF